MHKRTYFDLRMEKYGISFGGHELSYIPARERCELLLIAGIHGEETDTTIALSRACRSIPPGDLAPGIAAVLCANPDGAILGTRGNGRGVDLNRNFPAANWQAEPSSCRWHSDEEEELPILTGAHPCSEPESRALIELIGHLEPARVLTLHGPLACVDDPDSSPLGCWIAGRTGLPLVSDIGYPTPGSMGTWAGERGLPWITWEFPGESIETISKTQVPVLIEILKGNHPRESGFVTG